MDKRFEKLILKYAREDNAASRKAIEQKLWGNFGVVKTVFVMDLSGFSLLTQKYGVVHYLSMVRRMQIVSQPIIERAGGKVVKYEADNCFAMFDTPLAAAQTAIAVNRAFDEINVHTDERFDIRVAVGIDHGDILLTGGPDYFGETVNTASKLGEDEARPGEILISERALALIPKSAGIAAKRVTLDVARVRIEAASIQYKP